MNTYRIALANIRFPKSREESVTLTEEAIAEASNARADVICFPECFVPGYRGMNKGVLPPDPSFLERAWSSVRSAAARANVAVILGTERVVGDAVLASALVINRDGTVAGFQDKVQLDPSEDTIYSPGSGRQVFQVDGLKFGVAICHEGWRYPETVRVAVRGGAHVVFHPHFHEAEPGSYVPASFADPANSFHEKAALCRAAENTCYFATVNYAGAGSPTTSAVVQPDGTLLAHQPYGKEGLLVADIDITLATGLLASRYKSLEAREASDKAREASDSKAREASDSKAREASDSKAREASDSKAREASDSKAREASDSKAREASDSKAREAGDSIKPGAPAPGSRY